MRFRDVNLGRAVLLFLSLVLHGEMGQATIGWDDKGSGVDVVLCAPGVGTSETYDTFEAKFRHKLVPVFPPHPEKNGDMPEGYTGYEDLKEVLELAREIVSRLKTLDPELQRILDQSLTDAYHQVRFLSGIKIVDIEDFGQLSVPRGCERKQLIVQRTPYFPSDRRYTVSLDYWRRLPQRERAVGFIHEVLFQHARTLNRNLKTSESVRYFLSVLLSGTMQDITHQQYRDLKYRIFYWIY